MCSPFTEATANARREERAIDTRRYKARFNRPMTYTERLRHAKAKRIQSLECNEKLWESYINLMKDYIDPVREQKTFRKV